jgi:DNA-directed RNA polymerase subunit M/transcription elongation factor TFIIS
MKRCPKCKIGNMTLYLGGYSGILYQCKDCGYIGPLNIEEGKIDKKMKDDLKKTKKEIY